MWRWEDVLQTPTIRRTLRSDALGKNKKVRITAFFQWFVAPEGRQVGSLKPRVRSHLARWEMKIVRSCGVKHMSKSKCTKHIMFGTLLDVSYSKVAMLINNLGDSNSKEIVNLKIPWRLWFYGCIFKKRVNVCRLITKKLLTPTLSLHSQGDFNLTQVPV